MILTLNMNEFVIFFSKLDPTNLMKM